MAGANTSLEAGFLTLSNGKIVVENGATLRIPHDANERGLTGRALLQAGIGEEADRGEILVRGENAKFESRTLSLANRSRASLEIRDGGQVVTFGDASTAGGETAETTVLIRDRKSEWQIGGGATFGRRGKSDVVIDGGRLSVRRGITLAADEGAVSRLELRRGVLDLHGSDLEIGNGSGTFVFSGGEFHGLQSFDGDLLQESGLFVPASSEPAEISGGFTLGESARVELEIGKIEFQNDAALQVAGNVDLQGVIGVALSDGYERAAGDSFSVLSANSPLDLSRVEVDFVGFGGHALLSHDQRSLIVTLPNFGDSDLDGRCDSSDLVRVFQAGQYEDEVSGNSTWLTGDWNGDREFDSSDLVVAFTSSRWEPERSV
ncbi:hypothetical protein ACFL2H_08660 [Planctomycetota bacterium]